MGVVEGRDYLDDLEFILSHCGSNGGGDEKECRKYCDELDMEESGNDDSDYIKYLSDEGILPNELDSDYEFYLNKLGLNRESSSSEIPSEEVERMRTSNRDLESEKAKVPECSDGLSKKAKAVKKVSKIGDGGSKGIVRDVLSKGRKRMVALDEIREVDEDEDDSMPCKSNGEPSKENDSVNLDETYGYHLEILAKKEKKRKAVETNSDTSDDCSEKLFLEKQAAKDEDEDEDAMPCESSGEPLKKMNCVIIDKSRDEHQKSLTKQGRKAKAVSKLLKSGDERCKSKIRDVLSEGRKNVVNEVEFEIKEEDEDEDDAMPCKSSREPLKNSNYRHLNSLAKQGKNMVFSHEIDLKSIHQKDDNSSSDSEMIILEEIPFDEGGYTPFVPSKYYQSLSGEESWGVNENSSRSRFREMLMNRLKRPYDQTEFENLWKGVVIRKPVQGTIELRSGPKSYQTKTDGKSYLDWYEGLRVKVEDVKRDKDKLLYLLRGFFFWLENAAHEGAFQPWSDPLYLKALQ